MVYNNSPLMANGGWSRGITIACDLGRKPTIFYGISEISEVIRVFLTPNIRALRVLVIGIYVVKLTGLP